MTWTDAGHLSRGPGCLRSVVGEVRIADDLWVTATGKGNRPIRVLVVDADERVCESLAGLLQIGNRCLVVANASEPGRALELAVLHKPDVVILDLRLPHPDAGRDLVAGIRRRLPGTRIVVMAASDDVGPSPDLADAYVRKTYRPQHLLEAVAGVLDNA